MLNEFEELKGAGRKDWLAKHDALKKGTQGRTAEVEVTRAFAMT
jgi:hypothetical protein